MDKLDPWTRLKNEQSSKVDQSEYWTIFQNGENRMKSWKKYQTENVVQNSTKIRNGQTNGERRTQ